jgi:hypothetical protein
VYGNATSTRICADPLPSDTDAFSDEWMDKQGSERVLLFVILQLSF